MLPLSVLLTSNLEAPHKRIGVYITRETHPEGEDKISTCQMYQLVFPHISWDKYHHAPILLW